MRGQTKGRLTKDGITLHDKSDFDGMRASGQLAARTLDMIAEHVKVGVSTLELDTIIHDYIEANGATSATVGYRGYQHASCISLNHVVCHGIPSDKRIKDGDILNIDVTCILGGWYGDTSRMYKAGKLARRSERLIDVTHDALFKGIEQVKPGNTFGDIGAAIQRYVENSGCRLCGIFVVTDWGGCSTRRRTCCITGVGGRGRCWSRGCSSPLNRWLIWGGLTQRFWRMTGRR